MPACRKVLTEVDNNSELIVGDSQELLGQQLKTNPVNLLDIIIILILNTYQII